MSSYRRCSLPAGAALQRVLGATAKYRVCAVGCGNTLKQRNEIQQLSVCHVIKPRRHFDLQPVIQSQLAS